MIQISVTSFALALFGAAVVGATAGLLIASMCAAGAREEEQIERLATCAREIH